MFNLKGGMSRTTRAQRQRKALQMQGPLSKDVYCCEVLDEALGYEREIERAAAVSSTRVAVVNQ